MERKASTSKRYSVQTPRERKLGGVVLVEGEKPGFEKGERNESRPTMGGLHGQCQRTDPCG